MQSSNAPNKIQLPFAASGTKNTIPVPSQQGITPGAASYTDGFPPLTFTPLSAGGVPPAGADFNGILNSITALQQWKSAGGQFPFDATFATAIGGYPKGATVLKSDGTGLWVSTAENNTANPDTGGAGWLPLSASAIQAGVYNYAICGGAANTYTCALNPAPIALTPGMIINIANVSATNTAAVTLNVNGTGAIPIVYSSGAALQGGELLAGAQIILMLNSSGNAWFLVYTSFGYMNVPPPSFIGGSATFSQVSNNIGLSGIVNVLQLSLGDVIQVSGTSSNNNIFTIEAITDANDVIVNQAHANNAGPLSLKNETSSSSIITRLCKWYEAPLGLGQAYVNVAANRSASTIYTGLTNRSMAISASFIIAASTSWSTVNMYAGYLGAPTTGMTQQSGLSSGLVPLQMIVPPGQQYKWDYTPSGYSVGSWWELR